MDQTLKTLLRPHFLTHQGYISAGMESDKESELIFLNANENPYSLPGLEGINRYPEPQPKALLESYAKLYNVQPDMIMASRGADEAITTLIRAFCEPGRDAILIHSPTFGVYGIGANTIPANVIDVPLIKGEKTFTLDVDGIIANIDKAKLIFLCSPNNPTASSFPREDMLHIAKAAVGKAAVVIDETYIEFSKAKSMSEFLATHPNLVLLRTLSKSFSLAGARMGCMIAQDTDFVQLMRSKLLDVYPLPRGSVAAALKVMEPETMEIAKANIQKILEDRDALAEKLSAHDFVNKIYDSDANFLLVEMDRAEAFAKFCTEHNLYIRNFSGGALTHNCLRISVGTPEENDRLLELLSQFQ